MAKHKAGPNKEIPVTLDDVPTTEDKGAQESSGVPAPKPQQPAQEPPKTTPTKQSKAGLHKEISTIFDGVPIPKKNGALLPSSMPTSDRIGYVPPKPLTPSPKTPPTPKPRQPTPSPPKVVPPKQSEAGTTIKTLGQAPWQQTWEQIKNKLFTPKPGVSATRQKTMVILVPVLLIVMIFVFIKVLSMPSSKTGRPRIAKQASAVSGTKIDWQIPAPYPTTLRDPMQFMSVTTTQAETGKLIVKGIVYSEDSAFAVIGTRIVREGDKVSGATIVKINKDSVEFEMDGKRWTQRVQR